MGWGQELRDEGLRSRLISPLGLIFLLAMLGESLYVFFVSNPLGMVWVAGFVTSLPFALWIVYAGAWLSDSFVSANYFERIEFWCVGSLSVFLTVNIIIMITMPPDSVLELISWGRWAATLGAGVGVLIGTFEARGIERAVQVERERVRAEEAEAQNDILTYLNALIRHEILNSANVIVGHTDLILAEYDGSGKVPERIETIKSQIQRMEDAVEDVSLLLHATQDEIESEQVDITDLLTEEINTLQNTHQAVSIETSLPEHAMVEAGEPLRRGFANLLWNAVEHNDSDTPQIEVTARREPDTVVVQIADNGPGIPEAERETLFEQEIRHDDTHGLGLLLTHTLVENYDGTIEVTDTGPVGTVFTLTFPRASKPTSERTESDRYLTSSQTN